MKKISSILMILILLLTFTSCGKNSSSSEAYSEFKQQLYPEVESGIEKLQSKLKNPSSLQIKKIIVTPDNLEYSSSLNIAVWIDYSAKNDLGNEVDNVAMYNKDSAGTRTISTENMADRFLELSKYCKGRDSEDIGGIYKTNDSYCPYLFELDFQDYTDAGYLYLD